MKKIIFLENNSHLIILTKKNVIFFLIKSFKIDIAWIYIKFEKRKKFLNEKNILLENSKSLFQT